MSAFKAYLNRRRARKVIRNRILAEMEKTREMYRINSGLNRAVLDSGHWPLESSLPAKYTDYAAHYNEMQRLQRELDNI